MARNFMRSLYIVWKDEFNLGIPIIDEQHRGIVTTINTYHYFLTVGNAETILAPTLITLDQYAKAHFTTEENILEEIKYPELRDHLRLHNELFEKMTIISNEAEAHKDYNIVLNFLRQWWMDHIRTEDIKYSIYLKQKL